MLGLLLDVEVSMSEISSAEVQQKLDKVEKRAYELLDKYHACAQCSLFAIQEVFEMRDDLLAKAAVGLSGGVGGMRSACGALTGCALALGIKYGRDVSALQGDAEAAIEEEYAALEPVARLAKWFEREFGSIDCGEIRRSFMGTELNRLVPWQQKWIEELGMHDYCAKLVAKTARRAAAMLINQNLGILEQV
jgi:C_GCAxxG_C_C family probable redox protein